MHPPQSVPPPDHGVPGQRSGFLFWRGGRSGIAALAGSLAAPLMALTLALGATGCAGDIAPHGNRPLDEALAQIEVGRHARGDVQALLGTPSATSLFGGETWYYISNDITQVAFLAPEEVDRQVVAIRFGDDGRIAEITRLTQADGQDVAISSRETPTRGTETTVLQELLGNIGRFTPGQMGR